MTARSWLFIPGDSEKKLGKGDGCGADVLILDLEDSVTPDAKPAARSLTAAYLRARPAQARRAQLWVRINPLDTPWTLTDLVAIVAEAPDGIMLPKAAGPADVARLSHYLDALEAQAGLAPGAIRVLPIASETAAAPLRLRDYTDIALPRLAALTWGAEDLSAAVGASTNLDPAGGWAFTYRMVRSMTLLAAHAAGVPAIDTLHADLRDTAGLLAACRTARAEGFAGRLAIHPDQVAPINVGFTPDADEVAHARRVVDAFAAAPGLGALAIDGKMTDRPHLIQARRVLERYARAPSTLFEGPPPPFHGGGSETPA